MWEKRATSAEGQNYSNSRVLGYGQLGGCPKIMCKFLEKLLSFKETEMVMFMKNAHCVPVLTEQPIPCATTFTHLWEKGLVI